MHRGVAMVILFAVGCIDGTPEEVPPEEVPDPSGCTGEGDPLVGRWQGKTTLTLAPDGSFSASDGSHGSWVSSGGLLRLSYDGHLYLVSREAPFALADHKLGLDALRRTSGGTSLEGSTWVANSTTILRAGSSAVQTSSTTIELRADATTEMRFINQTAGMTFSSITPGTWTAAGDAIRLDLTPPNDTPRSVTYLRLSESIAHSESIYSRVCN